MHKNGFKKEHLSHSSQPCPSTPNCHSDPSSCLIKFLSVCVCVCVCVSRILLPSHTSTASQQPSEVRIVTAMFRWWDPGPGRWCNFFSRVGRLETQSRSDPKLRALLAKHSLPWYGSGVQRQLPVSMLFVNGNTSAPGCTLTCFVWVHEWLRQFDIYWQDKKRRETSHTLYHIQS